MCGIINFFLYDCICKLIIQMVMNNVGNIKDLSYVFLNVALCISAYKGLGYIKTFKEKKNAAIFTYWVQLRIRLVEIKGWLEDDNSLINYLFDAETRIAWESESGGNEDRIEMFKSIIKETIQFIKQTPDQMPAYYGWTYDYNKLICFLKDAIEFDICNGEDYFKFTGAKSIKDRDEYCNDICSAIERLCNGILSMQIEVEKSI